MLPTLENRLPRLSPVAIAVLLTVILVAWLLSGEKQSAQQQAPQAQAQQEQGLSQVETRWSQARSLPRELIIQGAVLPLQQVNVRAQVSGRVQALLKQQGEAVEAGEPLLQLSDEGRSEQLAEARAELKLRQSELESARALKKSQFVPETELTRLEGELARAQAEFTNAELAAGYNHPMAPFTGWVDRRHVEVGELVQPGDDLMSLVDVSQLKVTAQVPQQNAEGVAVGQPVLVELLDGRQLRGEVRFVSFAADPATRSFYVEAQVQNPNLWRVAGASATVHIQQLPVMAHRVSPALLSLSPHGKLGVHAVDGAGQVVFHPVEVVSMDSEGATVVGLPARVQLITQGAGFVQPGQRVQTRGAGE